MYVRVNPDRVYPRIWRSMAASASPLKASNQWCKMMMRLMEMVMLTMLMLVVMNDENGDHALEGGDGTFQIAVG